MMRGRTRWMGVVCGLTMMAGCSTDKAPLTPSGGAGGTGPASLKVSAPTVLTPNNGQTLTTRTPTLVFQKSAGEFTQPQVSYEIRLSSPGGDLLYSRTVAGGAADGIGSISHVLEVPLASKTAFRWRVRAVVGADAGPWSSATQSGPTMFSTSGTLAPSSSNDEFRDYFFSVIAERGVPTPSANALRIIEPDLVAVGIIVQKDSAGNPRGRLYLPTGAADKFARSVDVVTGFGSGAVWKWLVIGATKCEGICP